MSYSYQTYTGNGSAVTFTVPFGYISREDVSVRVNGTPRTITWDNDATIRLASPPASGAVVEVRRNTPKNAPLFNFQDAGILREGALDLSNLQALYNTQEALDAAEDAVTFAQGILITASNVPLPLLTDAGRLLRATGAGAFGWSSGVGTHLSLEAGDPTLPEHAARKAYVDALIAAQVATRLPLTGGTLSETLDLNYPNPVLTLSKGTGTTLAQMQGRVGTSARWSIVVGDGAAEAGGNAGSNFGIRRFSDAGALLDTPFSISRSTGVASFLQAPQVAGSTVVHTGNVTTAVTAANIASILGYVPQAALGFTPQPVLTTTAGVGQVVALTGAVGAGLTAPGPANSIWLAVYTSFNSSGANSGGVSVTQVFGGTAFQVASPGNYFLGFAIRVA